MTLQRGFLKTEPLLATPTLTNHNDRARATTNPYSIPFRPPQAFSLSCGLIIAILFLETEGDTIIKEGDNDRALFKFYIVEEGEARAYVHEDGEDVLMSHLRAGEETNVLIAFLFPLFLELTARQLCSARHLVGFPGWECRALLCKYLPNRGEGRCLSVTPLFWICLGYELVWVVSYLGMCLFCADYGMGMVFGS